MQSSFKYHLLQLSRGIITANDPGEKQAQRVRGLPKIAVFSPHAGAKVFKGCQDPFQHDLQSLNLSPLQLEPN